MKGREYRSMYALLSIDTAVLGYPVVRVIPPTVHRSDLPGFLSHLRDSGVTLAVWMPGGPRAERHAAQWSSLLPGLVVTPVRSNRIYVKDTASRGAPGTPPPGEVRILKKMRPTEDLTALAIEAGVESRYRCDPRIPPGTAEEVYRRWMRLACQRDGGSRVFACLVDGRNGGIAACRQNGDRAVIMLLATAPWARRRGVAAHLLAAVGDHYRGEGCLRLEVATREDNAAACRLYESSGYAVESAGEVYHLWFGRKEDRGGMVP